MGDMAKETMRPVSLQGSLPAVLSSCTPAMARTSQVLHTLT